MVKMRLISNSQTLLKVCKKQVILPLLKIKLNLIKNGTLVLYKEFQFYLV